MPKKSTTDATKILADIAGHGPKRQQSFEEEVANREVAQRIYELRQQTGLLLGGFGLGGGESRWLP